MTQQTNFPAYTREEAENRETFLALMWALSYPGRVYDLPTHAPDEIALFSQIGHSLLDLETTYFTPNPALAPLLKHTAARAYPYRWCHDQACQKVPGMWDGLQTGCQSLSELRPSLPN